VCIVAPASLGAEVASDEMSCLHVLFFAADLSAIASEIMGGIITAVDATNQRIHSVAQRSAAALRRSQVLHASLSDVAAAEDIAADRAEQSTGTRTPAHPVYSEHIVVFGPESRPDSLERTVESAEPPPDLGCLDQYWRLSGQIPGQGTRARQMSIKAAAVAEAGDAPSPKDDLLVPESTTAASLYSNPGACPPPILRTPLCSQP